MNIKEAIRHLDTYSSTNGSGQTTDKQHNEAKAIAKDIMKNSNARLEAVLKEIDGLPKTYPFVDHMDAYVRVKDAREIILSKL